MTGNTSQDVSGWYSSAERLILPCLYGYGCSMSTTCRSFTKSIPKCYQPGNSSSHTLAHSSGLTGWPIATNVCLRSNVTGPSGRAILGFQGMVCHKMMAWRVLLPPDVAPTLGQGYIGRFTSADHLCLWLEEGDENMSKL